MADCGRLPDRMVRLPPENGQTYGRLRSENGQSTADLGQSTAEREFNVRGNSGERARLSKST